MTEARSGSGAALEVDLAAKRFGDRLTLGAIRFSLSPGERVALLGPSGTGKSTLLAIAAGTDRDIEGHVARGAGRLAMVFQEPRLLPWRSLTDNIALIPGAGGPERARAALVEVGLGAEADAWPQKVSLGQQRRAALARALAVRPGLVLMDEPLVSLDAENASAMRALIRRVLDETGAAALIATHDRAEALALADRVLVLGGRPAVLVADRRSPLDRTARTEASTVEAAVAPFFSGLESGVLFDA
ncbi:MAG: ATP-binding cassette domain-containing protein [Pseudomonadota bacterium]